MTIASTAVARRVKPGLHPWLWATPAHTPSNQRSLFALLMLKTLPPLAPRSRYADGAILHESRPTLPPEAAPETGSEQPWQARERGLLVESAGCEQAEAARGVPDVRAGQG